MSLISRLYYIEGALKNKLEKEKNSVESLKQSIITYISHACIFHRQYPSMTLQHID